MFSILLALTFMVKHYSEKIQILIIFFCPSSFLEKDIDKCLYLFTSSKWIIIHPGHKS